MGQFYPFCIRAVLALVDFFPKSPHPPSGVIPNGDWKYLVSPINLEENPIILPHVL